MTSVADGRRYRAHVPSGRRSLWPFVLFFGLCLAVLAGSAAAVAAPSDRGRPWWHERGPQRVTGTVTALDGHALTLDGLASYDPARANIGTLEIEVAAVGSTAVGDTVDVDVTRHDGGWTAPSVVVLDTD
jgi:hypothetical protein